MHEHPSDLQEVHLQIEGMSCHSCAKGIEKAIRTLPEVKDVHVHFATGQATVTVKDLVDLNKLTEAVHLAGYEAQIITDFQDHTSHMHHGDGERVALGRFIFSAIFTFPFLTQMVSMLSGTPHLLSPWAQLLLATLVQFGGGWTFYRTSYFSARQGSANMDVLIALGTTAAYALSIYNLFWGDPNQLYFESSAVIITLVLLGRWLEVKSKGKASDAIGKLASIQPSTANLVSNNNNTKQVPLNEVVPGNILLVKAGERIPVDANVIEGESEVDEAMITGESVPRAKMPGSKVLAGTVNHDGSLRIQATGVGSKNGVSRDDPPSEQCPAVQSACAALCR